MTTSALPSDRGLLTAMSLRLDAIVEVQSRLVTRHRHLLERARALVNMPEVNQQQYDDFCSLVACVNAEGDCLRMHGVPTESLLEPYFSGSYWELVKALDSAEDSVMSGLNDGLAGFDAFEAYIAIHEKLQAEYEDLSRRVSQALDQLKSETRGQEGRRLRDQRIRAVVKTSSQNMSIPGILKLLKRDPVIVDLQEKYSIKLSINVVREALGR